MIAFIPDVLEKSELGRVRALLAETPFVDGGVTAGWSTTGVKNNLQITPGAPGHAALDAIVSPAIARSLLFEMAVRPQTILPLIFNRYEVGMGYGAHIDSPMVSLGPNQQPVRTDVSFTLFLSDPETYEGGELAVMHSGFEQAFNLPAGSMITYPSGTLHRAPPITQGARLACVGWAQSLIRLPEQRAILLDLDLVRRALFNREGKGELFDLVSRSQVNLLRLWSGS